MASYKTTGIVLKTRKLGEADRIIIIFTSTRGKVEAVAKGIRRTKSKFGARLEPFSEAEMFLHSGRNLDIITQAELIRTNHSIRENLEKIKYSWAILGLVDVIAQKGQSDSQLFHLLEQTLMLIDEDRLSPEIALIIFALKSLVLQGYHPEMSSCVECNKPYQKGQAKFSASLGGLICHKCAELHPGAQKLSEENIKIIQNIIKVNDGNLDLEKKSDLSRDDVPELLRIIHNYLEFHLHSRLKGWEELKK